MIKKILSILAPILFLTLVYFYPPTKLELASSPQGNDSNSGAGVYGGNILNSENKKNTKMENKTYTALLKTTEGNIEIALNDKETPITVNNFVTLAKKDFYNGTIFHRSIKDFMIQGGDPTGTGMGGPGYKFDDEKFSGEYTRGTVAMANSGPNTNGSQFFIMHGDVPLQKNYVIFGKVIKGIEVVDKIALAPVVANSSGEMSKPVKPVVINSVEIIEQ